MINKNETNKQKESGAQTLGTREEIIKWLDKYRVKNYTINDDLSVDVNGNVDLSYKNLKTIPVKFGKVIGDFWCQSNKLIDLIGAPKSVSGVFNCSNNQLTSLVGSPDIVGDNYFCNGNSLISLVEMINYNFEQKFCFNIDEDSFKQKELIKILAKYYASYNKRYELTNRQFQNIIKPVLEKEILQESLNNSEIKINTKSKNIFI